MAEQRFGQCLCGAVKYRADDLRDIWFCHCRQCRYVTGHFMAACRTENDKLDVTGDISWSHHSGDSQIGRCTDCGTPLFWKEPGSSSTSVVAGSLDNADGLTVPGHIFTSEKGTYYMIDDGLPQWAGRPDGGY